MPYGPLLTRQFGPNPKGSKLTIQEMDDNLLYLSESIASGGGAAFPFTGSAEISGSVVINSQLTLGVGPGASYYGFNTYNVALGYNNLQNNIYGTYNVAIGRNTLYSSTIGYGNIALGRSALENNTTGDYNVALSEKALRDNTIGNNNIALGNGALQLNTTGDYNIALGKEALRGNTGGEYNVALGRNALSSNTVGSHNVGLGFNVQSGNFSGSVILGARATATTNGQLALGSTNHPIGPVSTEALVSNKALQINLNGNLYKLLMYQA